MIPSNNGHASLSEPTFDGLFSESGNQTLKAKCRRVALILTVACLLLGGLALMGWLIESLYVTAAELPTETATHWRILAGKFQPDYVPMAPLTAGAFLLLGIALLAHLRRPTGRTTGLFLTVAALAVMGWASLRVLDLISSLFNGFSLDFEGSLVGDRGKVGNVASGHMSPLTGGSFLLLGSSLLLLRWNRGPRAHGARATCLLLLALINLLIVGGYIHGTPLLYGGNIIPVALTTALAFLLLLTALIAAAGPAYFPLKPLVGPSARATLLRTFLPVTAASVLIVGALLSRVYTIFNAKEGYAPEIPVFVSALLALASAGIGTLIVLKIAQKIGGSIDRAEAARLHALEELREARDVAEASNRAKSQFLANMSHELRTPLNAIIGYTELLQEEAEDNGLEDCKPDLDRIVHSARHLLTLINEILDLSKIEAGKVDLCPESIDVAAMIRDAIMTIRPVIEKKANRFVVDCTDNLGHMHADVTRLRQCLFNLLSNAGKFTEKGTITLRVRRDPKDGEDWLSFAVIDTGIGIPPEKLKEIFEPFTQADATTTRKFGGTGLGLTITLKLCRMMGGDIHLESKVGQGSTFTIRLPARAVPTAQSQTTPVLSPLPQVLAAASRSSRGNTVMVVDDDPAVRDILDRYLTGAGFKVVTVSQGEDVVRMARETKPQTITLDVMMPGVDGWSVLTMLKNDPEVRDIPVVMLSIVDDKNLGYALGAAEYLTKPVDRDRLLSVLSKYCRVNSPGLALVVEDDEPTRELLRRMLEKDGWEVQEAVNGAVALECVASRKPALILLDLMMPEMDGFEFLAEMRRHPEWKSIPVIVITAKDLTAEDRMFLNGSLLLSGCVKSVLQKGKFSRDELLNEVRHLVTPVVSQDN